MRRGKPSVSKIVSAEQSLTFAMDPQKRILPRFFPFRECGTANEPHSGLAVPHFAGDVVIFPGIRRREPFLNITPQLVTCQTISARPRGDANV